MLPMHEFDEGTVRLARAIEDYARDRIAKPKPLDGSASPEELWTRAGERITAWRSASISAQNVDGWSLGSQRRTPLRIWWA